MHIDTVTLLFAKGEALEKFIEEVFVFSAAQDSYTPRHGVYSREELQSICKEALK